MNTIVCIVLELKYTYGATDIQVEVLTAAGCTVVRHEKVSLEARMRLPHTIRYRIQTRPNFGILKTANEV